MLLALLSFVGLVQTQTNTPPTFVDKTTEMGIRLDTNAVCLVDIDNDGWTDVCGSTGIWHNNQGKGFTRVGEGGSFVAADFDNDGYVDLFDYSRMKLYHNNQGKGFTEVPIPALPATVSRGACWGDFNGDGFVDLYVGGYEDWDKGITYPSFILMNQGGKSFNLTWTAAQYRTRGVTACDFNRDGNLDIYVSNYRLQPNQLWLNSGNSVFRDAAAEYNVVATSPGFDGGHSIGACWGDFDNDGFMDLFAGNFAHRDTRGDQPKSRFLRNMGPSKSYKFEDLGTCGVFYQESYATPAAADFDNDGNLDLFFTTVYGIASFNTPNYPVLFKNQGHFKFEDVTAASGLAKLPPTYQAAWADFKHDGRMDLVTGGKLFVNQCLPKHWLEVRLHGDGKHVNRSAIGAQVRVLLKDKTLTRQVEAGTGEGNQNDLTLHFGLGEIGGTTHLEIFWPNKKTEIIKHVHCDQIIDLSYK
jgi:hypothetical protein